MRDKISPGMKGVEGQAAKATGRGGGRGRGGGGGGERAVGK